MQVFVPCTTFVDCARVLDNKRLGKQRVESFQIVRAIMCKSGWQHHPATKAWSSYVPALTEYTIACILEWKARGFRDSLLPTFKSLRRHFLTRHGYQLPHWWGRAEVHSSHRAALLFKAEQRLIERGDPSDFDWYEQWQWNETPEYAYVWPR